MRAEFAKDKKLMAEKSDPLNALSGRFRGFLSVVIDVETAGFHAQTDALLEIGRRHAENG
ncbi:Ribonuclease T [Serratia fonticola]|uniref:Ribonuclease T n=1 Tax=Serratia fonticola TaxID=47917 RepID=A0A4V6KU66_SERFO|nr:Ribonuclease T [Serratia fonticola]